MREHLQLFPLPTDFERGFQVMINNVYHSLSFHPSLMGPMRVTGELGHVWSCLRVSSGRWCVTGMG